MTRGNRGSALLLVVVITLLVVGIAAAYLAVTGASSSLTQREVLGLQALYCAETGAAVVISQINAGTFSYDPSGAGGPGPDKCWRPTDDTTRLTGRFGNGAYNVTVALWGRDGVDNNGNGSTDEAGEQGVLTLTCQGYVSGSATVNTSPTAVASDPTMIVKQVEVVLSRTGGGAFWNALYVGNGDGLTTTVTMKGGSTNADVVNGDAYFNANIDVKGQANLNGNVTVTLPHTVTDTSNPWSGSYTTLPQPPLDLASMDYATNHDIDVAADLAAKGTSGGSGMGGTAEKQITDAAEPSHIFRKNPSDRKSVYTDHSTKNPGVSEHDTVYVLEDPNSTVAGGMTDPGWDGGPDTPAINVTDSWVQSGTPTSAAFDKVYYLAPTTPGERICLAIDNSSSYSYMLSSSASKVQMTVVVRGNIVFADNTFYHNTDGDAIVYIAVKDPANPTTTGNIYYGDRRFGTVEDNNCYMYAENNVYVTNASAPGSALKLNGNMAAGGMVDFSMLDDGAAHHKLEINFDARLKATYEGTVSAAQKLDGIINNIPPPGSAATGSFGIAFWRQINPAATAMTKGYKP